jgi:hypothetical protein
MKHNKKFRISRRNFIAGSFIASGNLMLHKTNALQGVKNSSKQELFLPLIFKNQDGASLGDVPYLQLENLDAHAKEVLLKSMGWLDRNWDASTNLFRMPQDIFYNYGPINKPCYMLRETVWYSVGLFLRNQPGDIERAHKSLNVVLQHQYLNPNYLLWHGSWKRRPDEPTPDPNNASTLDINWREFIGTTLFIILLEYHQLLTADILQKIRNSLFAACTGTFNRVINIRYTNITLISIVQLHLGAYLFNKPEWKQKALTWLHDFITEYDINSNFFEYNSPTYYGINLYALALCRTYSRDAELILATQRLEAELWNSTAQFYHSNFRNLVGPYYRSYGMDLTQYASLIGIWIWLVTGQEKAPFPNLEHPLEHGWDFALAPAIALLGQRAPKESVKHFHSYQGETFFEQAISAQPYREASFWYDEFLMLGCESARDNFTSNTLYHPITIHWKTSTQQTAWIRSIGNKTGTGKAQKNSLQFRYNRHAGDMYSFEIFVPTTDTVNIESGTWQLPHLHVSIETNTILVNTQREGNHIILNYSGEHVPLGEDLSFKLETSYIP